MAGSGIGTGAQEAPPTVLDPGRQRPGEADVTEIDPDRPDWRPASATGLPPGLDSRFAVIRSLHRVGARAEVYLVKDRATDEERVLKLYDDARRSRIVQSFLQRKRSTHIVTVYEVGTEADRDYEIMEHLGGGTLLALSEAHPGGLDPARVTALVRQLGAALAAMHAAGLIHRDVKPSNIAVRTLEPFEVALFDFDISSHQPAPGLSQDRSGTVRYQPPEFLAGSWLSTACDWWALGLTVMELATGTRLLAGADDDAVRRHVAGGPLAVHRVVDDRLRLLCQGLLAQDHTARWGADQVDRWLAGESPPVPGPAPADPGRVAAQVPTAYRYLDTDYFNRDALALDLTRTWDTAAELLFRSGDPEPLARLRHWLGQYGPTAIPDPGDPREPVDVRLLRLVRAMDPSQPPIYRAVHIASTRLADLASQAADGVGIAPAIVRELWAHRLLPLLTTGVAADGLEGGAGLAELDAGWRAWYEWWPRAVRTVADDEARRILRGRDAEATGRTVALCLLAAAAGTDDARRADISADLRRRARSVRLPWFTELAQDPDRMWIALRLSRHAEQVAAERDEEEARERRHARWLLRNQRLREWSRRQNRPLALSWAVAGVFLMGLLCALTVSVSDIAGQVPGTTILRAWVATVFAVASTLGFESLLAWEIGGRFHPRYSMLGAGLILLGRAARTIAGRGIALAVTAGVLAGAYLLTVYQPVTTPLVLGGTTIVWAVARYLSWRTDAARERAAVERAARELGAGLGR
ncbi:serine/threonine protein kinase [Catenulispora sp. MAP5-51]|uniref:protein kinase domain-containing protein n=1 Tax=Catenulispora sp. MAP5-51 TaxID=3156298 RepID=UPI003516B403